MIFLKKLFKGLGLAIISFNRYNMAQGLLGRIYFKPFIKIKNYPFPYPHLKKIKKFQKFIFLFVTIFFKRKLSYLILRSGKFGNLVTSFFFKFFKIEMTVRIKGSLTEAK